MVGEHLATCSSFLDVECLEKDLIYSLPLFLRIKTFFQDPLSFYWTVA